LGKATGYTRGGGVVVSCASAKVVIAEIAKIQETNFIG
jgi:hypothetical protein